MAGGFAGFGGAFAGTPSFAPPKPAAAAAPAFNFAAPAGAAAPPAFNFAPPAASAQPAFGGFQTPQQAQPQLAFQVPQQAQPQAALPAFGANAAAIAINKQTKFEQLDQATQDALKQFCMKRDQQARDIQAILAIRGSRDLSFDDGYNPRPSTARAASSMDKKSTDEESRLRLLALELTKADESCKYMARALEREQNTLASYRTHELRAAEQRVAQAKQFLQRLQTGGVHAHTFSYYGQSQADPTATFFQELIGTLQRRMQDLWKQIEDLSQALYAAKMQAASNPQVLQDTLEGQHQVFLSLAAQAASVHDRADLAREEYKRIARNYMRLTADPFAPKKKAAIPSSSLSSSIGASNTVGAAPAAPAPTFAAPAAGAGGVSSAFSFAPAAPAPSAFSTTPALASSPIKPATTPTFSGFGAATPAPATPAPAAPSNLFAPAVGSAAPPAFGAAPPAFGAAPPAFGAAPAAFGAPASSTPPFGGGLSISINSLAVPSFGVPPSAPKSASKKR